MRRLLKAVARWILQLDLEGTDEPGFAEGFPEDRCPLCDAPVVDHPYWAGGQAQAKRALWVHRRAALVALVVNAW